MRRSQAREPCGLFKVSDHLNKWSVTGPPSEAQAACLRGNKVTACLGRLLLLHTPQRLGTKAIPTQRPSPSACPVDGRGHRGTMLCRLRTRGSESPAVPGESAGQCHSSFPVEEGAQRRRHSFTVMGGGSVSQLEGGSWTRGGHRRRGQTSQCPLTPRPQPLPDVPRRGYPVSHALVLALLLVLAASSHQRGSPVWAERGTALFLLTLKLCS